MIANNPTLDAITEIHEYNTALLSVNRKQEAVPVNIVVSLGTGIPPTTELKEIDVFRPDSIWDTAKLAAGISALGNLLVDQATLADGRVVDRARAWCSMVRLKLIIVLKVNNFLFRLALLTSVSIHKCLSTWQWMKKWMFQ